MKIYFASGNEHKKEEMSRLLGGYELVLPKEKGIEFNPEETGSTFIENAIIKAEALYEIVKAPVLSDDSGLIVRALNGQPGIYTARFGEDIFNRPLSAKEKYMYLLKEMEGIEDRYAEFTDALCLILSPTRRFIVQENCEGSITEKPSGVNGFGYDPIFFIKEAGCISAELNGEEKDKYSHRGKAARIMAKIIKEELND